MARFSEGGKEGVGGVIESKICILICCKVLSETFLIIRATCRGIIINLQKYLYKEGYLLFLLDFN